MPTSITEAVRKALLSATQSYKQASSLMGFYSSTLSGSENQVNLSSLSNVEAATELQARGIYDRIGLGWDKQFSRVPIADPYNSTTTTFEYVFFVKPDLHIMENGSPNTELTNRSAFFADAIDRYPHIVDQLQFSHSMSRSGGVLCPLLTNALNGSLELPGITAKTIETPQNVYGTKMEYRGSSYESDEGFDFSLDFKDTKFLEVYMWFKMYDEYEKMKWKGQVTPTKESYITNKILHDQIAIYKFIVAEDGMTLLYWARLMGAFPTSVPRDTFSSKIEGELTYSTNWHCQFVSDMDPTILTDFHNITTPYRGTISYLPLYDSVNHRFNPTWAKLPIIGVRHDISTQEDRFNKYYLLWTA